MKFTILFFLVGCAPIPFYALEGTSLEYCQSTSLGNFGENVKLTSIKDKVRACTFRDKISVEKCKGIRGDKISYIEKLRNKAGFLGGNILLIDPTTTPQTEGKVFLCTQDIYDKI